MLKYFDKPIPVVLISPITGKEYEAGGGGASYGGTYVEHLAKEDKQDAINQLQHQVSKGIYPNKLW